jgi:protein-tyrosine phosphatase
MEKEPQSCIPVAPSISIAPFATKKDPYFDKLMQKANKESVGNPEIELNRKAQKPEDKNPTCALEGYGAGVTVEEKNENKLHCLRCEKYFHPEEMDSHRTSHSSQILEWLYLGGLRNANNHKELTTRTNIKYILNTAYEVQNYFPDQFKYLKMDLDDVAGFDISGHFDQAVSFLEEAKINSANVLVHCQQGISRSASMVIAYLIAKENMSLKDALELVKSKRQIVNPNPGFMSHLAQFEFKMRNSISVELETVLIKPS